jgi:formylglycine-generating enzyme required for sulfatase activity
MMMNKLMVVLLAVVLSCGTSKPNSKEMIEVAGGSFIMGNSETPWNLPREVTLDSFLMAKYLVTVSEWQAFLDGARLPFDWDWSDWTIDGKIFRELLPSGDCPAQGLNWYYAAAYCNWLSEQDGLRPCYEIKGELKDTRSAPEVTWNRKANGYRLPTDAEWEYAARGGRLSKGYRYAGSDDPNEVALFKQETSYPVGQMKPNELGLYDMTGNVSVWCWDWFDANPGSWLPEKNPSIDNKEDVRNVSARDPEPMKVIRGTYWDISPRINVFSRDHYPPDAIGFTGIRLVRSR